MGVHGGMDVRGGRKRWSSMQEERPSSVLWLRAERRLVCDRRSAVVRGCRSTGRVLSVSMTLFSKELPSDTSVSAPTKIH